jgi:hypothetical protein
MKDGLSGGERMLIASFDHKNDDFGCTKLPFCAISFSILKN